MTDPATDLTSELQEHVTHAAAVRVLIKRAVDATASRYPQETPLRARVCAVLLVRIANDISAVRLLTGHGFHLQAATLVASTFEVAYAVMELADSDERAEAWLDHHDPTHQFTTVPAAVASAIRKSGFDNQERMITGERKIYAQLCLAKHANPLIQAGHGYQLTEEAVRMVFGSTFDDDSIRVGLFALQHVARLAVMAVGTYSRFHVGDAELHSIALALVELEGNRQKFNQRARARGWDADPLDGLWGRIEGRR